MYVFKNSGDIMSLGPGRVHAGRYPRDYSPSLRSKGSKDKNKWSNRGA